MSAYSFTIHVPENQSSKEFQSSIFKFLKGKNLEIQEEPNHWNVKYIEGSEQSFSIYFDHPQILFESDTDISSLKNDLQKFLGLASDVEVIEPSENYQETENEVASEPSLFRNLFIPHSGYWVTPILVYIHVLVYLLMVIFGADFLNPSSEDIYSWGGSFRNQTAFSELWRVFSVNFIHVGLIHLLCNMLALMFLGSVLESAIGKIRYLYCFMLGGATATISAMLMKDFDVAVGASGAIFGLYGVYLSLLGTNYIRTDTIFKQLIGALPFLAFNLYQGFIVGYENTGIYGALIIGLLMGFIFIPSLTDYENHRIKFGTIAITNFLMYMIFLFAFTNSMESIENLDEVITKATYQHSEYDEMYSMAIEVYNRLYNGGGDNEDIIHEINSRSLYYFDECIDLLEQYEKLNLEKNVKRFISVKKNICVEHITFLNQVVIDLENGEKVKKSQIDKHARKIRALENSLLMDINSASN